MKTILIFVSYYYPGYLSGGIARSIQNSCDWLGNEFRFLIVTLDRDLCSRVPYPGVLYDRWIPLGHTLVRYLGPHQLSFNHLQSIVSETPHDVLHLNSFFDPIFTVRLLLLLRLRRITTPYVLLSPRGEFGWGSLSLKYYKKRLYIELARIAGLFHHIYWHVSSPLEAQDLRNTIPVVPTKVLTALDLPAKVSTSNLHPYQACHRLKVVYLARITREKNLDGTLRLLMGVTMPVVFDIVGPQEDAKYWSECATLLHALPDNIQATYLGTIPPSQVFSTLAEYDLLFLPSHGENFGHVIAEALSVGTRVLISTLTPWHSLEEDGLGWDVDLTDTYRFAEIINTLATVAPEERAALRPVVREQAFRRIFDPAVLDSNRNLYTSL